MSGKLFILVLSAVLLAGCSSSSRLQSSLGNKYRYTASMTGPERSKDRLFRDDHIIVQFRFDECAVRFQLQNLSDSTLQIDWPHVSIGIRGVYSPVRDLSIFYDTVAVQPASCVIPPLGVVRDVILPKANIYFDGMSWRREDLMPTTDGNSPAMKNRIAGMVGSPIDLLLPLVFDGNQRLYHFTFAVDSVSQMRWDDYRPAVWLPSAPPIHVLRPTTEDRLTAIIVGVGIAGFLSYMLLAKKSPVSE